MLSIRSLRALAASVVIEAFETIEAGCRPGTGEGAKARMKRAFWWIHADDSRSIFSYPVCCELLELNPEHGRAFVQRVLAGEASIAKKRRMLEAEWTRRHGVSMVDGGASETALYLTEKEKARFREILGIPSKAKIGAVIPPECRIDGGALGEAGGGGESGGRLNTA